MQDYEVVVGGFIFGFKVHEFRLPVPAKRWGLPEDCYPAEDGTLEWELVSMTPDVGSACEEWPSWVSVDEAVWDYVVANLEEDY